MSWLPDGLVSRHEHVFNHRDLIGLHKLNQNTLHRDVNGIIKNSLNMPGSRCGIGPSGVKGQRPLRETEFSHFYCLKIGLSWTEIG